MTTERGRGALSHARALFDVGTMAGLTDPQLLDRFANRGGEASELAFAALVERHGPMVLRVCGRSLGDRDAAHDAFQATFLVLATKAGSLRRRESLASWLYGVALRVSRCARSAALRRQSHERRKAEETPMMVENVPIGDEDGSIVREEFDRLPDRYRAAMALCDLDDLTHEEAAGRLGWPVGTVKSRLARGRAKLRERLVRRGLAPASVVPMVSLSTETARVIPPALVDGLARAASKIAAGAPMAGVVPASTGALVQGVRRMMLKDAMRDGLLAVLSLGLLAAGAAIAADGPIIGEVRPARPVDEKAPRQGGSMILYETRVVEVMGTEWRRKLAPRLRPVRETPAGSVWIAHRADVAELVELASHTIEAPKVTAWEDDAASIKFGDDVRYIASVRLRADEETKEGAAVPNVGTIEDGLRLEMAGRTLDQGVLIRVAAKDTRLNALETHSVRDRIARDRIIAQVQVPRLTQNHREGEWLIGEQDVLLLSLGTRPLSVGEPWWLRVTLSILLGAPDTKPAVGSPTIERLLVLEARSVPGPRKAAASPAVPITPAPAIMGHPMKTVLRPMPLVPQGVGDLSLSLRR